MASSLFMRAARRVRAPTPTSLSPFSLLPHLQNPSPLPPPQTLAPSIPPPIHPSTWIAPSTRSARIVLRRFPFELSIASISSSSGTADERPRRAADGAGGGSPAPAAPPPPSWVELYLPAAVRPYALLARLDKPIGTWLLAWPCMWSITMAATPGELPDLKMLAMFGCGAVLLRGAGCTVNDLLDRDIDKKVERTKSRPFASGVLTPFEGLSFLGFQLLLGLGILLQLNNYR